MLSQEHFKIPLEAELKLRLYKDEIEECNDVKVLKENLLEVTTLLMRYQQILNTTLREVMLKDIEEFGKEIPSEDNG